MEYIKINGKVFEVDSYSEFLELLERLSSISYPNVTMTLENHQFSVNLKADLLQKNKFNLCELFFYGSMYVFFNVYGVKAVKKSDTNKNIFKKVVDKYF